VGEQAVGGADAGGDEEEEEDPLLEPFEEASPTERRLHNGETELDNTVRASSDENSRKGSGESDGDAAEAERAHTDFNGQLQMEGEQGQGQTRVDGVAAEEPDWFAVCVRVTAAAVCAGFLELYGSGHGVAGRAGAGGWLVFRAAPMEQQSPSPRDHLDELRALVARPLVLPLRALTEIHARRYLLRPTALELFFGDLRSPVLLDFPQSKLQQAAGVATPVRVAYQRLLRARREVGGGLGDKGLRLHYLRDPARRLQQQGFTDAWVSRRLSTFDYLQALNTFAGTSARGPHAPVRRAEHLLHLFLSLDVPLLPTPAPPKVTAPTFPSPSPPSTSLHLCNSLPLLWC